MPTPSKPTLIIGLGGIGSRIVEGVYRQFIARGPQPIDKRNVVFLCLDTDQGDIEKRRKAMHEIENNVVKTSSDSSDTISGYIERISHNTDVRKWFDISSPELNSMPLNKGAAQVRMASRLALMSAINEGKLCVIDNSINALLANEPERNEGNIIDTYIVCSLAGGTGAGSFLQTAYYVKNAMMEKGVKAPEITGFFLLADVLCEDQSKGLSVDQVENVRSNTYACIKELLAFCSNSKVNTDGSASEDTDKSLIQIEFEYKLRQRDKKLPINIMPYDLCYLVDFSSANGNNLAKEEQYENQVTSFVYLTAFSPTGVTLRSQAINNIRQMIQANGTKRFAGLGVSKLVYPVDDLFAYFSRRRVIENMKTSWCRIDKDFQEKYQEYKAKKREGIPTQEPQKGKHYMETVEDLEKQQGSTGAEFREIYRSTQILDKDNLPTGKSKAQEYFQQIKAFVKKKVESNSTLKTFFTDCTSVQINFTTEDNPEKDFPFVTKRERDLNNYKKEVERYIDDLKRLAPKQCFFDDLENDNYVSRTPDQDQHHLNTFILPKDEELHPIAVRYFLYDLQNHIKPFLAKLKADNKKLWDKIDNYANVFDDPDTKDKKETALDSVKLAQQKSSGVKKVGNLLTGQNPYKQAKDNYESKSRQQAVDLQTYTSEKLLEETLSSMMNNINRLLEESENFFDRMPEALREIENECDSYLKKHDGVSDTDITYVLASSQIKKDIYDFVISQNDSPFFPSVMSAKLYRSMYHNVCKDLNADKFETSKKVDKEAKKKAAIEANKKIIADCVAYQDKVIRESNNNYATKNVIEALKEEAMRECDNDEDKAKEYRERKFQYFMKQAKICGPSSLGQGVRFINSWGLHPSCVEERVLKQQEVDELFGSQNININPETAATREISDFFSPFEIVRANAVTLLSITENFEKFTSKDSSDLSNEYNGPYYVAYSDVIARVFGTQQGMRARVKSINGDTIYKDLSPHLDKRWHLPAYMPNIGSTTLEETKKILRALSYGLLFQFFKAQYNGGEHYWKHVGATSKWLRDVDKRMIGIGQSLDGAINNLLEKGLLNNPGVVDEVLNQTEAKWQKAKEDWLDTDHNETNELEKMKGLGLIKTLVEFRYNLCTSRSFQTNKNWFNILNAKRNSLLISILERNNFKLTDFFFEDLVEHIIEVFGPSLNTQKLCKYVLDKAGTSFKEYTDRVLTTFENEGRFEPKE